MFISHVSGYSDFYGYGSIPLTTNYHEYRDPQNELIYTGGTYLNTKSSGIFYEQVEDGNEFSGVFPEKSAGGDFYLYGSAQ